MTTGAGSNRLKPVPASAAGVPVSPEHYLRLIAHRKWLVLAVFVLVSGATAIFTYFLPNVYTSETLILVDPQKVPENYVRSTVTGDIRNRLGVLSQQILSETRLQRIIDTFSLFGEERKKLAREEIIARMRRNITVDVVSDFGATQGLQAFRIGYSGPEPRKVAQVANELASLFIEENLKAREQQATGTTEFLSNQLEEARKTLEQQEARLRDYKLKHLGEMPEQQASSLQIVAQWQSQLQSEGEALTRAEQKRTAIQLSMGQAPAPVVDLDEIAAPRPTRSKESQKTEGPRAASPIEAKKTQLATLLTRYTENHPAVKKLETEIAEAEAKARTSNEIAPAAVSAPVSASSAPAAASAAIVPPRPALVTNPVLKTQLDALNAEIAGHTDDIQRLRKLISSYQAKLQAIPVHEQELAELDRDYEMSKTHYSQLLDKQLSAETATQLEVRQKGERFSIVDPAQPAERPARPNRPLIDVGGALAGLGLGLVLALCTEFLGTSITAPEQIRECGIPVLEIIPTIRTSRDRRKYMKKLIWATVSGVATLVVVGAVFLYRRGM